MNEVERIGMHEAGKGGGLTEFFWLASLPWSALGSIHKRFKQKKVLK
jgi:hypothetical protein